MCRVNHGNFVLRRCVHWIIHFPVCVSRRATSAAAIIAVHRCNSRYSPSPADSVSHPFCMHPSFGGSSECWCLPRCILDAAAERPLNAESTRRCGAQKLTSFQRVVPLTTTTEREKTDICVPRKGRGRFHGDNGEWRPEISIRNAPVSRGRRISRLRASERTNERTNERNETKRNQLPNPIPSDVKNEVTDATQADGIVFKYDATVYATVSKV